MQALSAGLEKKSIMKSTTGIRTDALRTDLSGLKGVKLTPHLSPGTMTTKPLCKAKVDQHASIRIGLGHLHEMLALLPRARRQKAIVGLAEPLRRALIRHIEAGLEEPIGRQAVNRSTLLGGKMDMQEGSSYVDTGNPTVWSSAVAPPPQSCHILGRAHAADATTPSISKRRFCTSRLGPQMADRDGGNICTIRGRSCMQYFVRMTIEGVAISSTCTSCLEEARELRSLLAMVSASRPCGEATTPLGKDWLLAAFSEIASQGTRRDKVAFAAAPLRSGFRRRNSPIWSFRILVDARKWIGRIISTRRMPSISEALTLRGRLEEACSHGWDSLRAILTEHLPQRQLPLRHVSSTSHRTILDGECQSLKRTTLSRLHLLDGCYAATQKRRQASWARATSRHALRLECRLSRLAAKLTRCLQKDGPKQQHSGKLLHMCERRARVKGKPSVLLGAEGMQNSGGIHMHSPYPHKKKKFRVAISCEPKTSLHGRSFTLSCETLGTQVEMCSFDG